MIEAIDHVQLAAPLDCEGEARRFFGELVGLEEISKPGALQARGGVWFRCGAQQLHIGVEPDFRPARKAHPAFLVEDAAALRARLAAAGVPTHDDQPLEGYARFYAEDPFGNRIELIELQPSEV